MRYYLDNAFLQDNPWITVVGCGGTGGYVAEGLCRLFTGREATIVLVDHDRVEPHPGLSPMTSTGRGETIHGVSRIGRVESPSDWKNWRPMKSSWKPILLGDSLFLSWPPSCSRPMQGRVRYSVSMGCWNRKGHGRKPSSWPSV